VCTLTTVYLYLSLDFVGRLRWDCIGLPKDFVKKTLILGEQTFLYEENKRPCNDSGRINEIFL